MIHIFRAKDGRWTYCPATLRHWPQFQFCGEYDSAQQARDAVARDQTCRGMPVKVETGFFGIGG